jgi:hypothetical protein
MTNLDEIRQQLNLLKDEELVSILQEHDDSQWQQGVFDIVSSILRERGVSTEDEMTADADAGNAANETEGLDLVTVSEYASYVDAETDRLALEAEGLKAWIFNEHDPFEGSVPGAQLQVRAEDLNKAKSILESEAVPSSDLPPEIAEPPCPKCGSRMVTEGAEVVEKSMDVMRSSPKQVWLYHCASCGNKWSESA